MRNGSSWNSTQYLRWHYRSELEAEGEMICKQQSPGQEHQKKQCVFVGRGTLEIKTDKPSTNKKRNPLIRANYKAEEILKFHLRQNWKYVPN